MNVPKPHAAALPGTGERTGERMARRSRAASIGVALVLLGVSMFALWSSHATSDAATAAARSSVLSDEYDEAALAVAGEESLERKYRLEPGPAVQANYDKAAGALVAALARVRRDGDATDRARVDQVLVTHRAYLEAIKRMFLAVDRGNRADTLKIDRGQVDPAFAAISKSVTDAAETHLEKQRAQFLHLKALDRITSRLTPLVFLGGLLLAGALARITGGYRRLLRVERSQAIHDAMHDALTGLPNRTLLADRLAQALRAGRRDSTAAALLLIDLDRFKEINDTFGHQCGDLLLAQVGPRLAGAVREVDTVARLGGDEFAVLLPNICNVAAAVAVAGKLRRALERPFHVRSHDIEGLDLDVEASVGVVVSGEHGDDASVLLQRADIAMYVAKTQNLGMFAYDPELDGHTPAKLALLGDLRRALARDELVLHYQPKVSVGTGEVVGAEALVRWQHPDRGLVPPDEFIPLAERTGLIGPLTGYVLNAALAQIRIWADAGRPLKVAVNLSARNLLDDNLPAEVSELLAVHGVPVDLLELEVTESALMTEPVRAKRLLEQLAGLGIDISIDDFGAGYTSLGQLKNLPISELKVDRSFVTNMSNDRRNALIVHSVVDLGHNLGLTIVAEGVETADALSALAAFDCDIAQGYHLARPMPVEAFDAWYAMRRADGTTTNAPWPLTLRADVPG